MRVLNVLALLICPVRQGGPVIDTRTLPESGLQCRQHLCRPRVEEVRGRFLVSERPACCTHVPLGESALRGNRPFQTSDSSTVPCELSYVEAAGTRIERVEDSDDEWSTWSSPVPAVMFS